MKTPEKCTREVENRRFLVQGMAKNLADRLLGLAGSPRGAPFSRLEEITRSLMATVCEHLFNILLAREAEAFPLTLPNEVHP